VAEIGPVGKNDGMSSLPLLGRTFLEAGAMVGIGETNGPAPRAAEAPTHLEADWESSLVANILPGGWVVENQIQNTH